MEIKMKLFAPSILILFGLLAGCADSSYQPRQISKERATSGMPRQTGVLPNGIMEDSK
jgi:hypothetical protein